MLSHFYSKNYALEEYIKSIVNIAFYLNNTDCIL